MGYKMIDEKFRQVVETNKGCAVIFAGSDSDRPHLEKLCGAMAEYGIPRDVRICSAHKDPRRLMDTIEAYEGIDGALAYVAVAGGTDALSGTLSFHSVHPVISSPPDAPNDSCLKNPPGSPNAYTGNVEDTVRLVAQIFAQTNQVYRNMLIKKMQIPDAENLNFMPDLEKHKVVIICDKESSEYAAKFIGALEKFGLDREIMGPPNIGHNLRLENLFKSLNARKEALTVVSVGRSSSYLNSKLSTSLVHPFISCQTYKETDLGSESYPLIARPDNAASFITRIFSQINPNYTTKLLQEQITKIDKLRKGDVEIGNALRGGF